MVRPTIAQHVLSTMLLIWLAVMIAPLTFFVCAAYTIASFPRRLPSRAKGHTFTVLINGSHMAKALTLVRTFGKAGCRVILVEEGVDGYVTNARFSCYVARFYAVPRFVYDEEGYVRGLVKVALQESIDLFIPCSGADSTMADARAAEMMALRSDGRIRSLVSSASLTMELHDKGAFMDLLDALHVPCPISHRITSVDSAIDVISSTPPERRLILKATVALDDIGRTDWTLYPIPGDGPFHKRARTYLSHIPIPISPQEPFILQEFIKGREYCTHAVVVRNHLVAFVCCPSTSMLMYYVPAETKISNKAQEWTTAFLSAYSQARPDEPFTGHFSVDFIFREDDQTLYPIECNPRAHTAVTLLAKEDDLAAAYLSVVTGNEQCMATIGLSSTTSPVSWHAHTLLSLALPSLFTTLTHLKIHPAFEPSLVRPISAVASSGFDYKDAAWDSHDPWPFFALYHVQWPWFLAKFLVTKVHKRWSRINVSTGTIFEC